MVFASTAFVSVAFTSAALVSAVCAFAACTSTVFSPTGPNVTLTLEAIIMESMHV